MIHMCHLESWTISIGVFEIVDEECLPRLCVWADSEDSLKVSKSSNVTGQYTVEFWNDASACISISSKEIRICPTSSEVPPETLMHLLVDQVVPRVIAHEGALVLHAGAVVQDGSAIVLLGESGRGKSTLAASFLEDGWSLMGDDALVVSVVGEAFLGRAVYKSLRLFPDSLDTLFPVRPDLTAVAHYSPKHRVTVQLDPEHDGGPAPLQALFFLAAEPSDDRIFLRQMSIAEACMDIIANSFSLDPTDPVLAKRKLFAASALAAGVPAFELAFRRGYARLPKVHAAIRNQLTLLRKPGIAPILKEGCR